MTFECAVRSFGWAELVNFAKHLPETSATFRANHKDMYMFASELQQSSILADIYDSFQNMLYMFSYSRGGKPKKPQRFPRPWTDNNDTASKRIGSDAIPISEFNDWYYGGDDE